MSDGLPVRWVSSASRQVREAAAWWEENRPAAPEAIESSVREAVELIRLTPGIGAHATNLRLQGVRRVHLSRIGYHLYYRLRSDPPRIEVLAFWHVRRGGRPEV